MEAAYVLQEEMVRSLQDERTQEVNIFPNPFNQVIYMTLGQIARKKIILELCDSEGRVVLYKEIPNRVKCNQITIPANDLEKGVYMLRLKLPGNVITKKLIK